MIRQPMSESNPRFPHPQSKGVKPHFSHSGCGTCWIDSGGGRWCESFHGTPRARRSVPLQGEETASLRVELFRRCSAQRARPGAWDCVPPHQSLSAFPIRVSTEHARAPGANLSSCVKQAIMHRLGDRSAPALDVELFIDLPGVPVGRVRAQSELRGNLLVGEPGGHAFDNLSLAG